MRDVSFFAARIRMRGMIGADMAMPRGLGDRGKALGGTTVAGLPKGWELDEREHEILALAARQADDLRRLELELS